MASTEILNDSPILKTTTVFIIVADNNYFYRPRGQFLFAVLEAHASLLKSLMYGRQADIQTAFK